MTRLDQVAREGDNYACERFLLSQGYARIAGCDEAGRGPLAGPVVAATVILPDEISSPLFKDSKALTEKKRDILARQLHDIGAIIGVGIASAAEIDVINIFQASLLAMYRSVEAISPELQPDFILVDGKFQMPHQLPQCALIKGESKSGSIAAASIIAKTTRDALMVELHHQYPMYNFIKHKGYPTKEHKAALRQHGPSPIHRMTFAGVSSSDDFP